jgi:hypothetical protein
VRWLLTWRWLDRAQSGEAGWFWPVQNPQWNHLERQALSKTEEEMEARQFPYESKPCDGWAATKELLDQTTLLLVAQVGPTVFNVRGKEKKANSCAC